MPRSEIVASVPVETGIVEPAATAVDTSNGHYVQNDGRVVLRVQNADGAASHTLTVHNPSVVDGIAVPDRAIVLTASTTQLIRIGPVTIWNQPGTNWVTFDGDSSQLKVQAMRVIL